MNIPMATTHLLWIAWTLELVADGRLYLEDVLGQGTVEEFEFLDLGMAEKLGHALELGLERTVNAK